MVCLHACSTQQQKIDVIQQQKIYVTQQQGIDVTQQQGIDVTQRQGIGWFPIKSGFDLVYIRELH